MQIAPLQIGLVVLACIVLVLVVQWLSLRRTDADRHARILEGRAAAATLPQAAPRAPLSPLPARSPLASPRGKIRPVLEESTSDDDCESRASLQETLPTRLSHGLIPRIQRSESDSDSSAAYTKPIHHRLSPWLPARSHKPENATEPGDESESQRSYINDDNDLARQPSSTSSQPDLRPWITDDEGPARDRTHLNGGLQTLLGMNTFA